MYCPQCGREYEARVNFCCHCGTAMTAPRRPDRKLTRSRRDKKIAGVCGGVAEYLELDSTLVRLVWLMLAFVGGWGVLGYLVAWIIMPEEPKVAATEAEVPSRIPQPAANH